MTRLALLALLALTTACGGDDDDDAADGDADSDSDSDTDTDSDADTDADADADADADTDADTDADADADADADGRDCTDAPESCGEGYACACWFERPNDFCQCGRTCDSSEDCTAPGQGECCEGDQPNAGICTRGGCACAQCP